MNDQVSGEQAPAGAATAGTSGLANLGGSIANRPRQRLSIGSLLAAVAGVAIFGFSFAPFVGYDAPPNDMQALLQEGVPPSFSVWSGETFMAPLSIFPVLLSFVVIGLVAWSVRPGGAARASSLLNSRQLMVSISVFVFLILFGYAVSAKTLLFGSAISSVFQSGTNTSYAVAFGWGGVMMMVLSLVMVAGAVLHFLRIGPDLLAARVAGAAPAAASVNNDPGAQTDAAGWGSAPTSGQPGGYGGQHAAGGQLANLGFGQQQSGQQQGGQQGIVIQPGAAPSYPQQAQPQQAQPQQAQPQLTQPLPTIQPAQPPQNPWQQPPSTG